MTSHLSNGVRAAAFFSITVAVLAGGCDHPRPTPARSTQESAPPVYREVSQTLVGKHITIRGKLLVGKPGAGVLLDNQQVVYLISREEKSYSQDPYDGMYGKLVEATGTLRFYHSPYAKTDRPVAVQIAPDHFYFDEETAQLRLISP